MVNAIIRRYKLNYTVEWKDGFIMRSRGKISRLGVLLVICLLLLAIGISGCGKKTVQDSSQEPIKIGAVLDISGPGSSLGIPERDSIKLWEEQTNARGGINGRPVQVLIMDNESDETKAVLAFKKLVSEKVVAVVGCSQSGTSIAMIKSATQEQVPMVSPAASVMITTPIADRKWVFKTAQNDSVVVEKIIEYLKKNNLTKIAFLSVNNAYGDSGLQEFSAAAKTAGIDIVVSEKFGASDVDFTPQISNVKKNNPAAMLVWAIPPSASLITKQARDLGVKTPIVHSHGIANQTFIQMAGEASNGVVLVAGKILAAESLDASDPQKKVLSDYISAYEKADRPRSAFGGYGYDAMALIGKAIEKAGPDRAKIRDELEKIQFAGVSGIFNMSATDHSGISKDSLVLIQINNGKWELMK
jgi:branched-chain amino acid transport system substrate-binding protein